MDIQHVQFDTERYPATQQDFATIRKENMLYIDKTEYIYRLTRKSRSYFLSRPRRFGKSMLLSTIAAYFEGRRELFRGLAIDKLEQEWLCHPVISISLGSFNGLSVSSLHSIIQCSLELNATKLGLTLKGKDISAQFMSLISQAHDKTGRTVVVLIDEYDKPLNETRFTEDELHETLRAILRGFYSVLKDCAAHLRFVMLTGVTKYTHVSIFSGLNNLKDLSLEPSFNAICGISESEMSQYFANDMAVFGNINGLSNDEAAAQFKRYYDGYRFASTGENIYNPYSVMNAFASMRFSEYWFETGTPNHLIQSLEDSDFDFDTIEGETATASELMGLPYSDINPLGLLYQTGYLTIKDYDADDGLYTLGFPNKEVKSGFYGALISSIAAKNNIKGYSAANVRKAAQQGKPERLVELLSEGISSYNCLQTKGMGDVKTEALFNSMLYGLCSAIGVNVKAEYTVANGIIDLLLKTKRFIYLIECKKDQSATIAMQQINTKDYAAKFRTEGRTIFKIGLNYDSALRQINDWLIEEVMPHGEK